MAKPRLTAADVNEINAFQAAVANRSDIARLKARLFERGGKRFQHQWFLQTEVFEELGTLLLDEGAFRAGENLELRPGEPRHCHENVWQLVRDDPKLVFVIGLGLGDDDCWRVHSWAVDPVSETIIETTVPCRLYFGVALQPERLRRLLREATRRCSALSGALALDLDVQVYEKASARKAQDAGRGRS